MNETAAVDAKVKLTIGNLVISNIQLEITVESQRQALKAASEKISSLEQQLGVHDETDTGIQT